MPTTHVFIVDHTTFQYHLEYMFAGTGAKEHAIDFNNRPGSNIHYAIENMLTSMIADSQRVRVGDYAIFYLQQNIAQKIYEGRFYGVFKVKEAPSFLDHNDSDQFLKLDLKKSLTFRTLLESYQVYAKGVTEWEALDEITNLQSPHQMLWSLIYRKLKGNRGNTMITLYESDRLVKLIRDKNVRKTLDSPGYSFEAASEEIIATKETKPYTGRKETINVLPRLTQRMSGGKAFESHLQAYIVQNIGRGVNNSLDDVIIADSSIVWLGNEVSCGVGMQRIDVMLLLNHNNQKQCVPIELKAVEAQTSNIHQVQRYVDWIQQYYIPNMPCDIRPVLLSKRIVSKSGPEYAAIIESFRQFNRRNPTCLPLEYIEYDMVEGSLLFTKIPY